MGLFCIVVGLSIVSQKKLLGEIAKELEHNQAFRYFLGVVSLTLGLLVVLTHNVWNNGFLAFVVTLIGWLMVARGVFAMFVSHTALVKFVHMLRVKELSWMYGTIIIILGVYLAVSGFSF